MPLSCLPFFNRLPALFDPDHQTRIRLMPQLKLNFERFDKSLLGIFLSLSFRVK